MRGLAVEMCKRGIVRYALSKQVVLWGRIRGLIMVKACDNCCYWQNGCVRGMVNAHTCLWWVDVKTVLDYLEGRFTVKEFKQVA